MKNYLVQQIRENALRFPNRTALALDDCVDPITYSELWVQSGRIYTALKEKNIGREDFVMIFLPRHPIMFAAMLGVLRAGAAFIFIEDTYPMQRVEFIRNDCGAKLVLDAEFYRLSMNCSPLDSYAQPDPHDACFAVYTSGSTGRPKGVLHEYGELENAVSSVWVEDSRIDWVNYTRYAYIPPMNFVAVIFFCIPVLYSAGTVFILSYNVVKNLTKLSDLFEKEQINETFLPPSVLRIFSGKLPYMRRLRTGSEPCNGIFREEIPIINTYALSESAFVVAQFRIDRAYDKTPIGKSPTGKEIFLLDEDGKSVPQGEVGEICFVTDYMRGYINLPEQTAIALRNGVFHTGDLGYRDQDGNLIISGRKDDMIKINGNRIEPAEIEAVAKERFGLKNAIAKGFNLESRSFVVLYYLKNEICEASELTNPDQARAILAEKLPYYMIPSYFVGLDAFPLNANGKIAKKELKPPAFDTSKTEYIAPRTEMESRICDLMARALKKEKIGVTDDFFDLGGDSMSAISLISECGDLGLKSDEVYNLRTAEKLAAYCEARASDSDTEQRADYARLMKERLMPRYAADLAAYRETGSIKAYYSSIFAQNPKAFRDASASPCMEYVLKEPVDAQRLQKAVNKAVQVCPYAQMEIVKETDSETVIFRDTELPVIVHPLADNVSFGTPENNHHAVIIACGNHTIRFAVSHVLTDGYGMMCFIRAVMDAYFGKGTTMYDGFGKPDYVADLMKYELPINSDFHPVMFASRDGFIPPEARNSCGRWAKTLYADAEKVNIFCRKNNISQQVFASLILGQAIVKAHPENEKVICVRSPVNCRAMLNVPHSFHNASIPHIFLNMIPADVKENSAALMPRLQEKLNQQITYDNLAYLTNKDAAYFRSDDPQQRKMGLLEYKNASNIFANYMGNMFDSEIASHIETMENRLPPSFPLMLYMFGIGKRMALNVIQSFDNPIYAEALKEVLWGNEIRCFE